MNEKSYQGRREYTDSKEAASGRVEELLGLIDELGTMIVGLGNQKEKLETKTDRSDEENTKLAQIEIRIESMLQEQKEQESELESLCAEYPELRDQVATWHGVKELRAKIAEQAAFAAEVTALMLEDAVITKEIQDNTVNLAELFELIDGLGIQYRDLEKRLAAKPTAEEASEINEKMRAIESRREHIKNEKNSLDQKMLVLFEKMKVIRQRIISIASNVKE